DQARLVTNNMTVVRKASTELVQAEAVTVDDIVGLHAALLPGEPRHHGLRTVQNWVGGSAWHPIDADFVPPRPDLVPGQMQDLVDYLNGAAHSPLVQAALVHAQFETIHPFTDGNGRTGRALIHAMLRGHGLTRKVTVPVSAGLLADTQAYFDTLTAYREGDPAPIVAKLANASFAAVANGRLLVSDLNRIREAWNDKLVARRGSAARRLADVLLRQPVIDAAVVADELGTSVAGALRPIRPLVEAGVLTEFTGFKRNRMWQSREVLSALDDFAARAGRRNLDWCPHHCRR
ncbi:MAG: Fic family protein, partial [Geodermatophilaceae bacterium]|nr:Fic family protein [Geodermatophilaceae bacterium]